VPGGANTVDHIALEVLDTEDSDKGSDFEIFGINGGSLNGSPLHIRVDGCPDSWIRMLAPESSEG
jgi:hypothetical protein